MSVWTTPSPSDFERWEARVAAGETPHDAAKAEGFNGSSTFKRADPVRHGELMAFWRDTRDATNQQFVRKNLHEIASDHEHKDAVRATELLGKTAGLFVERSLVEHSGGVSHPDVSDAIERFTSAVVQLAGRSGAGDPALEPGRHDEGEPRVRVAEVDSASESVGAGG